jgi:hypothetical protein
MFQMKLAYDKYVLHKVKNPPKNLHVMYLEHEEMKTYVKSETE